MEPVAAHLALCGGPPPLRGANGAASRTDRGAMANDSNDGGKTGKRLAPPDRRVLGSKERGERAASLSVLTELTVLRALVGESGEIRASARGRREEERPCQPISSYVVICVCAPMCRIASRWREYRQSPPGKPLARTGWLQGWGVGIHLQKKGRHGRWNAWLAGASYSLGDSSPGRWCRRETPGPPRQADDTTHRGLKPPDSPQCIARNLSRGTWATWKILTPRASGLGMPVRISGENAGWRSRVGGSSANAGVDEGKCLCADAGYACVEEVASNKGKTVQGEEKQHRGVCAIVDVGTGSRGDGMIAWRMCDGGETRDECLDEGRRRVSSTGWKCRKA
ncbi:hypothetical protein B0H16DRAFT_1684318 [Mycena metata]|uniref:Uncharacterized protein n=1 Tax=Mycena metata TaxID=1033252 RepID=A0AAD7NUC1_9AGAR|nr:hypothetical protein B0H16DRAFT_1684318 [Mycena metata]